MWNNNNLILIDTIDDYINIAEEELDYIKSKLIEYLGEIKNDLKENSNLDNILKKEDIYNFLSWYESNNTYIERVSVIRCKQILNFIFYGKLDS